MITTAQQDYFRTTLLEWYATSHRPMPWKAQRDPYLIWLSEIILQQTRVAQGLPYFERFYARFPEVKALAEASADEVMKLWEGLGYYSRARNLHTAAKEIVSRHHGRFPDTYADILALKGVGPYTAAAIASFAYDLPYAVLDGNVFRVLSRFWGIDTPIDSTEGKKRFGELAQACLHLSAPGTYNQAIMDFGATRCTPRQPACKSCPLQANCAAFRLGQPHELPVKSGKIKRRERFFHYFLLNQHGKVWIHRREEGDIWAGLYEFPLIEWPQVHWTREDLQASPEYLAWVGQHKANISGVSPAFQQQLTHQNIAAFFWEIEFESDLPIPESFIAVERKKLSNFAWPKVIATYLEKNSLYLNLI